MPATGPASESRAPCSRRALESLISMSDGILCTLSGPFVWTECFDDYPVSLYVVHMQTGLDDADRVVDKKRPPIGDPRRTTWPHHINNPEPLLQLGDKPTFSGILHRTDLANQARTARRSGSIPAPSRRSSDTSTT